MTHRSFVSIILLFIASIAPVGRAYAAADSSTSAATAVTGIVSDTSGGTLPGVTVTLTPTSAAANAEPLLQVTDGDGRFTFDHLGPGTYTVVFSLPGFDDKKLDAVSVPATEELRAVMSVAGVAETVTVQAGIPASEIPREPIGEAKVDEHALTSVALPNDRFEEALPLLPGIVRGPDGLLNMNGTRADQSAVTMNGINMTDPVTNHFAVRLPLEAIESLNVHSGVYSAAFGNAAGGVTDIVTKSGEDTFHFQGQNFMPRIRFTNGGAHGIDAFTPRVRFSGPIEPGKLWFSEAVSFRFVRTRVDELEPLDQSEQKVKSFDAVSQIDYAMSATQHVTGTFVIFPSNIDNLGIDTLHPYDASPDLKQRGWIGAIGQRAVLSDSMTWSSAFAFKQFNVAVAPKYDDSSLLTVSGLRENYFNTFDRDSRRYDATGTLSISAPNHVGDHLIRVGGQFAHTSYDGTDRSLPIAITGANGATLQRIEYTGSGAIGASNTEIAGFAEDHWEINRVVTLNGGVRYAWQRAIGEQTIAPRIDAAVRPFEHGNTVIKGGIGRFYDALPLNAVDFESQQSRQIASYDAGGAIINSARLTNQIAAGGLQMPVSTAWNTEVDQMLTAGWLARVGYRETRGSNQLVVDPLADEGVMLLSNRGRSRSREFEFTVRRTFKDAGHVTASYVHSRTWGDLNDFVSIYGDLREPVIYANEYSRQAFDTPNRFLVWGVINMPHAFTVAPTVEYRNGFPYTVIDEHQNVVGQRNQGGRYPDLMTFDLAVTKDLRMLKHRVRVGLQVFNLTDHFNPQDVQNNLASPSYGDYANSVGRQVRAKFVFLF